jgi:hypothetical protein
MSDWWSDISEGGAWQRAMDPLDLWTPPPPPGPGETPWDEGWLDATRWWADAMTNDQRGWPEMKGKLLAQIAGGLARAFRGRRIDVQIQGRNAKGRLDWILLDRDGERCAAHLRFSSIEYDGLELAFVSVAAESVDLSAPPDVAVAASGIWIEAQVSLASLVAWLDRRVPEWGLEIAEGGVIEAVRRASAWRYLGEAVVLDDELELELRGLVWRGMTLRVPTWLRLTRKLAVPDLPEHASVVEARRRGAVVDVRLSVPTVRQQFDLARLREAMSRADAPT